MLRCEVAARVRERQDHDFARSIDGDPSNDGESPGDPTASWGPYMPPLATTEVANPVANVKPEVANRHGKYADPEKRRAYQRELMRRKRAEAKARKEKA